LAPALALAELEIIALPVVARLATVKESLESLARLFILLNIVAIV
jgi:hypothetical protein